MSDIVNYNDSTPAAPAGATNVKFQVSGTGPRTISAYLSTPYDLVFAYPGAPPAAYTLWIINFTRTVTYAANWGISRGACGSNPSATALYTISKNGGIVGTVSISTSGIFTFATSGGAVVTFNAGDKLTILTPAGDLTLADVTITLSGTR